MNTFNYIYSGAINSTFISNLPFFIFIFFIFGFIWYAIFSKSVGKANSKYNSLLKKSILALSFGVSAIGIIGISSLINAAESNRADDDYSVSSADGYTVEKYVVEMDVSEKNSIDIRELITVNFYDENHHGIYRFIPEWLKYTNKDGVIQSREARISKLTAVDDYYQVGSLNNKAYIKIGNPNRTLPIGDYTYEIKYTYDMGFDPYEDFDEFIFHAFGDYWGTRINNASVIVHFPKDIEGNNIKFFTDKYRNNDITSLVDYKIEDNTLYADLSEYPLDSALTIDVVLPDNYFVNANNNYGFVSFLLCVVCIVFAVIAYFLWLKNGKDLPKVEEKEEFYPPEGFDAAEVGYLYKRDTGRKLSVALMIELASKGYIKINEDAEKTITISKVKTTDVNKYINRTIKIKKLRDYKSGFFDIHFGDGELMKQYFPNNTTESNIITDFDNFYKNSKYLVDKGYMIIESDSISNYTKEQLDKIQSDLDLADAQLKQKMTTNEELVYSQLFLESDETVISDNVELYKIFGIIAENVRNTLDDKINDLNSYKYMLITSIGFFISTICLGAAYSVVEDLDPRFRFMYLLALISTALVFIFAILMKRKNDYGEQVKSKIEGFKKYIETSQKDKIDSIMQSNNNYFFDILPYAYILDVSTDWAKKFENIPTPDTMGNFNYCSTSSIDDIGSYIHTPSSSGSSGGCSSCGGGGGCSSCGGGCSSCGGGGGW